ncbi:hypothetical protein BDM02DRAFT_3186087 [Thelephora ganbajun]|uniref:Uncharacterized protein n=1 Tax=Thelephora ganbajun TaxID=370292 RepID=A0ACB6ZK21_THEGA|nr:hypothetical protein BDM02DRAFT_3186087 [Thelephora ganbajun]
MSLQAHSLSAGDHDTRAFSQAQPTHAMSADDTYLTSKPDLSVPVDDNLMARSISPVPQDTPSDETHVTHDPSSSVKRDPSSASPSPKESGTQTPASRSTPPPASTKRTKNPKPPATGPQLIGHLPKAEEAAKATFVEIPENLYQYGTLGKSREALESMMCDCQYEHGVDSPWVACGEGSECINRLTQVECMPEDCRCRGHCKNQRFQRKRYAPIDIVLTEKKGFGLRAAENLSKDTFIYEYVGDVLSSPSMKKRMREYGKEGIQHFYFMMLQKDEFIDATKKGGIGRFANHSCNPNCYVAKWTIGDRVRMGIFSKRAILKHEELTFNYNVDRYGHEAQQCFCGESNCVGYIGGKTQTDLAAMDDLYIDALGISEEVEKLGLKGGKRKKSKKLDEDYAPILKPLQEKDVPKVIQAIRQTSSRKVLLKLLTRIKITEDKSPLRQLMRLRGFSLMTNILQDYSSDPGIQILVMECVSTWPLLQKNKIEDSKINMAVQAIADAAIPGGETLAADTPVKPEESPKFQEVAIEPSKPSNLESNGINAEQPQADVKSENAEAADVPVSMDSTNERHESQAMKLRRLATKLLEEWETLETGYRIPKRLIVDANSNPVRDPTPPPVEEERPYKRAKVVEEPTLNWLPTTTTAPPSEKGWAGPKVLGFDGWTRPQVPEPPKKEAVDAIIAAARATAAANALQKAEKEAKELAKIEAKTKVIEKKRARKEKEKKPSLSKEEKEALKEKKLKKIVGAVVVKTMSKYQKYMDRDQFKKYAQELTEIIAEKEKKSSNYKEGKLDAFSDEKTAKIKKFAKEYITKVIRKIKEKRKKQQQRRQSTSGSGSPSRWDSLGNGDADDLDAEGEGEEMSAEALESMVAEAIDLGGDDCDNQGDEEDDMDIDDQEPGVDDGGHKHHEPAREENSPDDTDMVVTPIQVEVKDPRLRLRVDGDGDGEPGWGMNQAHDPMVVKQGTLVS